MCETPFDDKMYMSLYNSGVLTEDDDLDDLSNCSDAVLHLQGVVSSIIDCCLTHHKTSVFAVAVDFNAFQAVLHLHASKEPGADGLRTSFDGHVQVDGFSTVHMDYLLRDAGHVDHGHY